MLTTLDGTRYELTRDAGSGMYAVDGGGGYFPYAAPRPGRLKLNNIVQRTGDRIEITTTNIQHRLTNGAPTRSISFERDSEGRITAIRDPLAGVSGYPAVKYFYGGASGNLLEVHKLVDRATGAYLTNKYFYHDANHPHYLTSMEDARGIQVARQLYDDSGKLIGIVDASGRTNSFSYNLTSKTQVITDRLGNPTTYQFDPRGNVTAITNALQQVTRMVYDDLGNKTSEVNALMQTNVFAYNLDRLLLQSS